MTAAREVLDGIRGRLTEVTNLGAWETTRANDVVIYAPNGFGAYKLIAHADTKWDTTFIAAAPTDVARLVAAVEAVLGLHTPLLEDGEPVGCAICDWETPGNDIWPCATIAAIEAALKEGE